MRFLLITFILLFSSGCITAPAETKSDYLVLKYEEFGPQAMAHEIIGMEWWQWNNYAPDQNKKYDINVVVYRNMEESDVALLFPIDKTKNIDYRYLTYYIAKQFLNKHIDKNIILTNGKTHSNK